MKYMYIHIFFIFFQSTLYKFEYLNKMNNKIKQNKNGLNQ